MERERESGRWREGEKERDREWMGVIFSLTKFTDAHVTYLCLVLQHTLLSDVAHSAVNYELMYGAVTAGSACRHKQVTLFFSFEVECAKGHDPIRSKRSHEVKNIDMKDTFVVLAALDLTHLQTHTHTHTHGQKSRCTSSLRQD